MQVDAVVFDIGNVLIEWNPERAFDAMIGPDRRAAFFDAVPLHALNDRVDAGANFHALWNDAAREYPDWAAEIGLWRDNWLRLASPAIPHSVRLLRALRARGIPVLALTNFGIETWDMALPVYPFLAEFDRHFISAELRLIKPDPAIYAALEDQTGYDPRRLLFTDDRQDNIDAAATRGWQVHHFDGPSGWAARLVASGLLTEEQAR